MPIISVVLAEGRSTAMKRDFIRAVTDAAMSSLGVRAEQVRIILNETPLGHYAVGGVTFAEANETQEVSS
ncbi:tautomerase family protein [Novosphingobium naphthalenivorans]|uniref:tautomerase family protein n=1 Tax=Novosphingobium naphthalenivorans TaxID=273168 RepID=UPI00083611C1|nr:tautomerase family protein [Novosphingobium naphthalenivorans]